MTAAISLPRATPESHGLPSAALLTLLRRLESEGLDPHALIVARHGQVLLEAAWAPHRLETPALVYSVSKTFTALAIGYLEAEGTVDLGAGIDRYLDLPNPHGITVRHLLTMNTGHSREQTVTLPFSAADLLTIAPEQEPGTAFAYNSPATYTLGLIIAALTGQQPSDYLRPRLLDPLGIPQRWWRPLPSERVGAGTDSEQAFSGFHLTVDDVHRLTIALVDGGRWNGEQIIPAAYVQAMAQPWSDNRDPAAPTLEDGEPDPGQLDWALGYGYQVWRSIHGFRLDGAYGQFGLVIPERGITLSYQGATTNTQATLAAFWELVDSFVDGEVPTDAETSAELALAVAGLDSWTARPALSEAPENAIDVTGWELAEAEGGWRLTLPSGTDQPWGTIAVGEGSWLTSTLLSTSAQVLHIATQGEHLPDGAANLLLVDLTSPHRIVLRRESDGSLRASWSTVPLWRPELATLTVPTWITTID